MIYYATVDGKEFTIDVGKGEVKVDGQPYLIDFQDLSEPGIVSLLINNRSIEAVVDERDDLFEVLVKGELYSVHVQDERTRRLAQARGETAVDGDEFVLKSPMPGIIVSIPVVAGQHIKKGDRIIILESMKMENELRSPRDGIVARIQVEQGASVEKDQVLAVITDEDLDD